MVGGDEAFVGLVQPLFPLSLHYSLDYEHYQNEHELDPHHDEQKFPVHFLFLSFHYCKIGELINYSLPVIISLQFKCNPGITDTRTRRQAQARILSGKGLLEEISRRSCWRRRAWKVGGTFSRA